MLEVNPGQFGPNAFFVRGASRSRWSHDVLQVMAAHEYFERAQRRAHMHRLWARITRRSRSLLDLSRIRCSAADRHYVGLELAPIDSIRGSEGRCRDFDCDFLPLQPLLAERWVSVFVAITQGLPMPPVVLIRAGDVYFVRDGHHRISVARVQGRQEIEAEVTVWNVQTSMSPTYALASVVPNGAFQNANLNSM